MKLDIVFIGSGNVAWHLAEAMDKAGHHISQIISKSEENAKALAVKFGAYFGTDLSKVDGKADVCFICVPDDEIQEVVRTLPPITSILVHTCGPKKMDILSLKATQYGVFYPLQTFSKSRKCNMLKVPILLESSGKEVYEKLFSLADSISNKVLNVNSDDRLKYHLAAVFANNFANHLFYESAQYLESQNLDFNILKPLILETAEKVQDLSPKMAQTGPAKRHDQETIKSHLALLNDKKDLQELYQRLTEGVQSQK